MRILLAVIMLSLSFSAHAALTYRNDGNLQACIESCQSLLGEPMYEIKRCVARCQSQFGKLDGYTRIAWCETYEPGCTRPGDGDEDGRDDRDQDNEP